MFVQILSRCLCSLRGLVYKPANDVPKRLIAGESRNAGIGWTKTPLAEFSPDFETADGRYPEGDERHRWIRRDGMESGRGAMPVGTGAFIHHVMDREGGNRP